MFFLLFAPVVIGWNNCFGISFSTVLSLQENSFNSNVVIIISKFLAQDNDFQLSDWFPKPLI